jgi:malate dehydrogenase (oxaloacetate-decarboxylating)(NADP+)
LPETEILRASAAVDLCESPTQKYRQLISLLNTDERTFYGLLEARTAELLPILYTPTVGDACLQYGTLTQRPPGLTVGLDDLSSGEGDATRISKLLASWPHDDIRIAVITDGERVLGLGDQGANGMGISAGKSMVYAACGLKPSWLLPVHLDVGTENETLLTDPLYVGDRRRRERGEKYDRLLEAFVAGLRQRYGEGVIVHWEDLAPRNAFRVLQKFRNDPKFKATTYNDDIQGTAAVTVAGIVSSSRAVGVPISKQRVLFFGAGQANVGAANLLALALTDLDPNLTIEDARKQIWLVDSKGLVYKDRASDNGELSSDKTPFAADLRSFSGTPFDPANLAQVVKATNCSILVGAAAVPGAFTKQVIEQMTSQNPKPIVFALSNPTSKAECTAEQAYEWSRGNAVFASGTKFPDVFVNNEKEKRSPGFANNAFIFPGIALGSLASGAASVTDAMFLAAATCLAGLVTEEELKRGQIYPSTSTIKETAFFVGAAVAAAAAKEGVARKGACAGGITATGKRIPSLDGEDASACVNWEACVRDYAKTCL